MTQSTTGKSHDGAGVVRLFCVLVFAAALARLCVLVAGGAVNVLYGDQWDFLTPVFEGRGPLACFDHQHGPHRMGAGGVLQWFLFTATDWDARSEAWAGVAALSAAAIVGMRMSARLRGKLSAADAAWAPVCLGTMHWETLTLATDIAHSVLPLAMIVTMAFGLTFVCPARRAAWLIVWAGLCLFTGFGLAGAAAAAVVAAAMFSPRNGRAVRVSGVAVLAGLAASAAVFAWGYRFDPAVPGWRFPVEEWWNYGTFAGYMAATASGLRERATPALLVGLVIVGAVLGAFLSAWWRLWRDGWRPKSAAIMLLCGSSLVYMVLTAIGRLPVNLEAAFMWRYTTLTATGLLGLMLWFDDWRGTERPKALRAAATAAVWLLALGSWSHAKPDMVAPGLGSLKRDWAAAYLSSRDLQQANRATDFGVYPPDRDSEIIARKLRWLEERGLSMFARE